MSVYALTAVGRDRPGIVSAISSVLLDVEGNIEDSQMSILRGHFAVMLIVAVPDEVGGEELGRRLEKVRSDLELEAIALNEVEELAPGDEPTHVLTVYGSDHPGIVHGVTATLAEHGANITDLQTRLTVSGQRPVYVMLMEIAVPGEVEELRAALRHVAEEAELDVSLRERERDLL
jgi:glycine cleavage system transcriptional repressor